MFNCFSLIFFMHILLSHGKLIPAAAGQQAQEQTSVWIIAASPHVRKDHTLNWLAFEQAITTTLFKNQPYQAEVARFVIDIVKNASYGLNDREKLLLCRDIFNEAFQSPIDTSVQQVSKSDQAKRQKLLWQGVVSAIRAPKNKNSENMLFDRKLGIINQGACHRLIQDLSRKADEELAIRNMANNVTRTELSVVLPYLKEIQKGVLRSLASSSPHDIIDCAALGYLQKHSDDMAIAVSRDLDYFLQDHLHRYQADTVKYYDMQAKILYFVTQDLKRLADSQDQPWIKHAGHVTMSVDQKIAQEIFNTAARRAEQITEPFEIFLSRIQNAVSSSKKINLQEQYNRWLKNAQICFEESKQALEHSFERESYDLCAADHARQEVDTHYQQGAAAINRAETSERTMLMKYHLTIAPEERARNIWHQREDATRARICQQYHQSGTLAKLHSLMVTDETAGRLGIVDQEDRARDTLSIPFWKTLTALYFRDNAVLRKKEQTAKEQTVQIVQRLQYADLERARAAQALAQRNSSRVHCSQESQTEEVLRSEPYLGVYCPSCGGFTSMIDSLIGQEGYTMCVWCNGYLEVVRCDQPCCSYGYAVVKFDDQSFPGQGLVPPCDFSVSDRAEGSQTTSDDVNPELASMLALVPRPASIDV